jgi:hypothetical protein
MSKRLFGVLLLIAAFLAAAAAVARPSGARAAYPAQCATTTSPFAGAPQPVVYGRAGLSVRRFTKPGRSPLFAATADTHYISTGPLLNPTTTSRRQVRGMLGTAYAAVNGDFFTSFGTLGVEVARGGRVVKGTSGWQYALTTAPDQSVAVARVQLTLHLNRKLSATRVVTTGFQTLNGPQAPANGIDVFTNAFGSGTQLAGMHWAAQPARTYVIARGHIAAIYSGAHARPIPAGGALVVVQGGDLSKVAAWHTGSAVSVSVSAHSPTVPHVWAAVGSSGPLIYGSAAWGGACGYDAASPRTVAGVFPGGHKVVLVTATGHGLTTRETIAFLRSLGVAAAIPMDGGGSTVMAVRQPSGPQQLTVHPYVNEGDRPVPNGIGMWRR